MIMTTLIALLYVRDVDYWPLACAVLAINCINFMCLDNAGELSLVNTRVAEPGFIENAGHHVSQQGPGALLCDARFEVKCKGS